MNINVSRVRLTEGQLPEYNFDFIARKPSDSELKRWGISSPKGDRFTKRDIFNIILKYVNKYVEFNEDVKGIQEDFKLTNEGRIDNGKVTPERLAFTYMALMRTESYESLKHFKLNAEANGKKYSIIPNMPIRNGKPVHMGKNNDSCIAFGRTMISAYADVISNKDECREVAWNEEKNIEVGLKAFLLKYKSVLNEKRAPALDCAIVAYHSWHYGDDVMKALEDEYYERTKGYYLKYNTEERLEELMEYSYKHVDLCKINRKIQDCEQVKKMQRALMEKGYNLGKAKDDGVFGTKTEAAIVAFQKKSKLDPTGVFDIETRDALYGYEPPKPEEPTPNPPEQNNPPTSNPDGEEFIIVVRDITRNEFENLMNKIKAINGAEVNYKFFSEIDE